MKKAKKFLLLGSFFLLILILAGCVPGLPENTSTGSADWAGLPSSGVSCYVVDQSAYFRLSRSGYKNNAEIRYVRVYASATIPSYKIGVTTRKVKDSSNSPMVGYEIHEYTEAGNRDRISMREFLLAHEGPIGSRTSLPNQAPFDVYLDENELDRLEEDFIQNCQPTGGTTVVMVPPAGTPQAEMPNAFFEKTAIDHTGYEMEFNQVQQDLGSFYVKVSSTNRLPQGFSQIGTIPMTSVTEAKTYDVDYHLGTIYLVSQTEPTAIFLYEGTDEDPRPANLISKTLKLDTIKFVVLNAWNWFTPECKPVLYFYPTKPEVNSVWVKPRGYLTLTEPDYGWGWQNLWLTPEGKIFYQGRVYPYLHYEAMIGNFAPPKTGYLVKRQDLPNFFDNLLPKVGLNSKEAGDFKEYWLSRLVDSPFFQVSVLSSSEIEAIEPVEFSVLPQTFIRVRLYFKGLDSPVKLPLPELEGVLPRKGFTVVEWGGLYSGLNLKND